MFKKLILVILISVTLQDLAHAQEPDRIVVEESMKDYIKENHLEAIEDMVHSFASSRVFLSFLLEKGHNIDPAKADISRRDVRIGDDLDVYVKHLTEHQNFSMIMIPVDIYSELIYDTLLFSILEVSDDWLHEKYRYHDLTDEGVKERLMSLENHEMLARHMYEQAKQAEEIKYAEVEVKLHESYISSSSIHMHMSEFTKSEKKQFRKSWGLMKKAFAHNVDLNLEMNIYVFGSTDLQLVYYADGQEKQYKITPRNIFTRHVFKD